eukprot:510921-Lingulodinium_polyedra.AAC.1
MACSCCRGLETREEQRAGGRTTATQRGKTTLRQQKDTQTTKGQLPYENWPGEGSRPNGN